MFQRSFWTILRKSRGFKVDAVQVKFKVNTNVPDATVELDGMAIGSAPGNISGIIGSA